MKEVILTKEEYNYLINNLLNESGILIPENAAVNNGDCIYLHLSEEMSDDIRELAADEVVLHFDENYKPTAEGWILEHFIDKFFTG